MLVPMQFVDLHLHSKYSRACSSSISLDSLAACARLKGLTVLGTGDFTHPLWLKELKQNLLFEDGAYRYDGITFIPSTEISLIYTQGGRGRRIHHLILAEDFGQVDQINDFLRKKGRLDYDGRPMFGFSSIELVEQLMSISKDIMVIPAHAWTPWYGIFGSMSGFKSLQECFQDKTKYVHAIETGLSSDPKMNWRLSNLDEVSLVSFSDAHSAQPWRLGRECCALECAPSYKEITDAMKTKNKFAFTVEFFPEEGKYHFDGHRNCNFSCSPEESKRLGDQCPQCGSKMTIGVLHRVEELADRPDGFVPKDAVPFKSLMPLTELIAALYNTQPYAQRVAATDAKLIDAFGNEFNVLLTAERDAVARIDEKLTDLILQNRAGALSITPGYDGVYGKLVVDPAKFAAPAPTRKQKTMKQFLK